MKSSIVLCIFTALISIALGQEKPTKEQVEQVINQLVGEIKEGIKEINGAIKTEKDAKLKKFYQEVLTHLEDLKKGKEACSAQLKKDGNVDKAIQTLKALLEKHHKEMEAFHKKHPANS